MKCNDCNKQKLPLGKSMHDGKFRCTKCNRLFIRKYDKELIESKKGWLKVVLE